MSKLALVMHGGGMRGAYGAGVVEALTRMMASRTFDMVLGTSAGAANAAGLVAGMGEGLKDIWTHLLDLRRFIHPLRPRWITDTDYLITLCSRHGLTRERVRAAAMQLRIAVTHYLTGRIHFFGNDDDILTVMHASISMPVLCRTPVYIGDEPYLDGGITANTNLLVARAFAEGADRVVALDLSSPIQWVSKVGLKMYARRKSPGLRTAISTMLDAPYPEPIDAHDEKVYLIRPLHVIVSRLTRTPLFLKQAYAMGVKETLADEGLKKFLE